MFALFCVLEMPIGQVRGLVYTSLKNGPVFKPPVSVTDRSKAVIQLVFLRSICFVSYVLSCAVIIMCVYVPPSTQLPRLIFNECFIIDFGHGNTISLVHSNIHI